MERHAYILHAHAHSACISCMCVRACFYSPQWLLKLHLIMVHDPQSLLMSVARWWLADACSLHLADLADMGANLFEIFGNISIKCVNDLQYLPVVHIDLYCQKTGFV